MKLDGAAVQFISKILILVLHEFVEEMPDSVSAVQSIIKKLFPSSWGTFVVKVWGDFKLSSVTEIALEHRHRFQSQYGAIMASTSGTQIKGSQMCGSSGIKTEGNFKGWEFG